MKPIFILALSMLVSVCGRTQVDVTASTGTLSATYTTLKAALDAVNAGTHTGVIAFNITANTTEVAQVGAASATLNASGSGAASYTSLTISPTGGGSRTITGAATAGFPLLNLNGADNVTIDGLNSGGNSLLISNTMISATVGTCTIQFINDATSNTINRCTILGGSTMTGFRNGSTIYFSTGPVTGNDNNTISNCDIGPLNASDFHSKAICSIGTTTTAARNNSGNTVTACNVYDYFSPDFESTGILIREGNTDWTITNNKLYQTAARTQTTGAVHSGIRLQSTSFVNCTITGNTIGYSSNTGTGTYTLSGTTNTKFYPIDQGQFGSTTASSIQNNTITAIAISGNLSGTGSNAPFIGIRIFEGKSNVGTTTGNTIGTTGGATAIAFTTSSTSAADFSAIHYNGGIENSISNNNIGGITIANSSSGIINFYGILSKGGAAITTNIQSNTIGYSAATIAVTATTGAGLMAGILDSTGAANLTSNTVSYLSLYSSSPIVTGIKVNNTGSTSGNIVSLNTVSELSSSNAGQVYGIIYNGANSGTHQVHKNKVHSLGATTGATIYGIGITAGLVKVCNNMIRLGMNAGGNITGKVAIIFPAQSLTTDLAITGLRDNSTSNNEIYFNSIYIGGEGVSGSSNTFALYHTDAASTRVIQNNILFNARSNGAGTGKHYAVLVGGSGSSPAGLTLNYNDYYVTGTGGVLGSYNGSDVTSLTNWRNTNGLAGSGPGLDVNSFFSDPAFIGATHANPNLHVNSAGTPIEGRGINIGSITDDFDEEVRASLSQVDIGADALNAVASVLPVTFLSFSGKKTGEGNLLQWVTSNESNNTGFEIQRSQDGVIFNKIGFVVTLALSGTSSHPLNYAYADHDKKSLVNYYRLKQIDLDGKSSYSQVIVIKNNLQPGIVLRGFYPNPVVQDFYLQVEAGESQQAMLWISDMAGRILRKQPIRVEAGYQVITVPASLLPAGCYTLQLSADGFRTSVPFIHK